MYNIYINNYIYLYVLSLIQKMGYMCAPTYANIFMSECEERFIYPLIKNKSSSYLGFKTICVLTICVTSRRYFYGVDRIRDPI